jgi:hypothetical protein
MMNGDISRYLVPIKANLNKNINTTEEKINSALISLFNIKANNYKLEDKMLQNSLYDSTLEVENIITSSGVTIVNLK